MKVKDNFNIFLILQIKIEEKLPRKVFYYVVAFIKGVL